MSDAHFKRLALVLGLVLVTLAASFYLIARPPSPTPVPPVATPNTVPAGPASSTQPKVTWSQNQVEVILSPGESTSKDLTFTSSLDLQEIVIEAAPAIAGFLTVQPNTFVAVPAVQLQSVHISFSIPEGTAFGTYEGTIHVRVGSQTLPQPLKVSINVWKAFQSVQAGYSLKFPPELEISNASDSQNLGLITPSTKAAQSSNSVEAYDDISIVVVDSIGDLPLFEFADRYDDGWYRSYSSRQETTIAGRNAVYFSDIGAPIGHAPMVAVFVEGGTHIFIFTINLYASPENIPLVGVLNQILSTFQVTT